MIHSIEADNQAFKKINFRDGFNVVLAERAEESTKKSTRNGLGKSTLIEIIQFCLGGVKGETLKKRQLDNWAFTMEIDLDKKRYFISRSTDSANKVLIDGDCSAWPIKPAIDNKTARQVISRNDWTKVLGHLLFNLQTEYESKYHPTFRSLISYFARKNGQSGGFLNPFQQHKQQLEWDIQVNNSYLLGIGWEYARQWQLLKDRKKVIEQIKHEAQTGMIANLMGNIGELEASKIRLKDRVDQEEKDLTDFKVHQQYKQIEDDANEITEIIHEKTNQNVSDKRLLRHYEASLKEETDARPEAVAKIYKEAGLVFPDKIVKKISEVREFHRKIVLNRKEFLKSEMDRIETDIRNREEKILEQTSKRSELMRTLRTHGALNEYTQLQKNRQDTVAELKDISQRLENLKKFEEGKGAITVENELLRKKAILDLEERYIQRQQAILTFNSFSESLYEGSGSLSINVSNAGYKFNVKIQKSGSHAIGNMKIFCYDLMLAKIWAKKPRSPSFLIHDSIIFADVDERQKAHALQLAESESRKNQFQYICTMNSDTVPYNEFGKEFNFDKHVVTTFTDAKKDGGLLGTMF